MHQQNNKLHDELKIIINDRFEEKLTPLDKWVEFSLCIFGIEFYTYHFWHHGQNKILSFGKQNVAKILWQGTYLVLV